MPTCALCHEERQLRESHIIPAFVFRWMRRTSGGSYLRHPARPDLRVQDGARARLLCGDCEGSLGTSERWFKDTVFTPYIDHGTQRFEHGPQLFRFLVSLHWRYLSAGMREHEGEYGGHLAALAAAEEAWRAYLLTGAEPVNFDRVHVLVTRPGAVRRAGRRPVPSFNRYVTRDVDATIGMGYGDCFVYVKFARFISWVEITRMMFDPHDGTRVAPAGGVLQLPQRMTNGHFGAFVAGQALLRREQMDKMSDRQRAKVHEEIAKRAEQIADSDAFVALLADALAMENARGAAPSSIPSRRIGLNAPCSCGSGKKYKKCCRP